MVEWNNVAQLPEAEKMVRRDPTLADKFPRLPRWEGIATDADRERYGIKSHARLNVPTCMTIEDLAAWSEKLYTLAQDIKVVAADTNRNEIEKLMRVQMEVAALNRETLDAIQKNRRSHYERKAVEK